MQALLSGTHRDRVITPVYAGKILRYTIIFLSFILQVAALHSQSYRVTYDYKQSNIKARPEQSLLVFNDTLSYSYSYRVGKDPYRKNIKYGSQFFHGALFYDTRENLWYEESYVKDSWGKYLVFDTMSIPVCQYLKGEKYILGYRCQAALGVDSLYDSTLVWFTTEIKNQLGPMNFTRFPGLVLEINWIKLRSSLIATKIEKGEFLIKKSGERLRVSRKEFLKRQH